MFNHQNHGGMNPQMLQMQRFMAQRPQQRSAFMAQTDVKISILFILYFRLFFRCKWTHQQNLMIAAFNKWDGLNSSEISHLRTHKIWWASQATIMECWDQWIQLAPVHHLLEWVAAISLAIPVFDCPFSNVPNAISSKIPAKNWRYFLHSFLWRHINLRCILKLNISIGCHSFAQCATRVELLISKCASTCILFTKRMRTRLY